MQGLYDPLTKESTAFQNSKNVYQDVDPNCAKIKEYKELEGEELPGTGGLSARQNGQSYLFLEEQWGLFPCSNTGWGNCQYAAVQRGTQFKREVTSIHIRRFMVVKMCKYPMFFCQYLHRSL